MTNAEIIWKYFKDKKMNPYGIAGIMGNMQAESSLMPNNLQNTYNIKFGMSDDEYTKAVDNGSYKNFVDDAAGYGLVQFTYSGYKKELYNYCKEKKKSISDIYCQLDCLTSQITKSGVLAKLNSSSSVRQASDIFLLQYERPADQSEAVQKKRAEYSMTFYNQFTGKDKKVPVEEDNFPTLKRMLYKGMVGEDVRNLQSYLIKLGYGCGPDGADGDFGTNTYNAVIRFQSNQKIEVDGIVGNETWNTIKKALGGSTTTPVPEPTPTTPPKYPDVMVGSSSQDERGQYHSGSAGDQTGREVWILKWYNSGWHTVIRPKTETLAEKIASACEKGCNNPNIGYDQDQRNTLLAEAKKVGFDLSKITTPCECDCSSFVSTCCVCAGLQEDIFFPWGNGCTTRTLAEQCEKSGQFTLLKTSAYINNKNYLKRGDILLSSGHTVIVLSDGINAGQVVPTVTTTGSYLVRITADSLNVRAKSTVNSTIVTQVHKGDIYTIIEEREGWGKLKSGTGWISLNYTQRI